MLRLIDGLPEGAVGIEARGRVTRSDRARVVEPRLDAAFADGGRIRLLYVAGEDFAGYEDGGAFDDAVFGSRHFNAFQKIAFVAEDGPWDRAVSALAGLMPAALRIFAPRELAAAKAWLAA